MQVSMNEYVNHTLASDTLFLTTSSPTSFDFWFPIHRTCTITRFFSFSLSFSLCYFTFSPSPSNIFLVLFLFYFLEGTYLRIGFLTICSRGTPRNVISIHPHHLFLAFRFLQFFVDETYTRTSYTWPSLLFCPQKMIFIIICVLISAVILVAIIIGCLPWEEGYFLFVEEGRLRGGKRGAFKSFKGEGRKRKGKRVRRGSENVTVTLIVVII